MSTKGIKVKSIICLILVVFLIFFVFIFGPAYSTQQCDCDCYYDDSPYCVHPVLANSWERCEDVCEVYEKYVRSHLG